ADHTLAKLLARSLLEALDTARGVEGGLPADWSPRGVRDGEHATGLVAAARELAAAWYPWLRLMDPQTLEWLRPYLDQLGVALGFSRAAFDAAKLGYEAIEQDGAADDGAARAAMIYANLVGQLGGPPLRDDQIQDDYIQVEDIQAVLSYLLVEEHELRGAGAKREHFAAHPEILAGGYPMSRG